MADQANIGISPVSLLLSGSVPAFRCVSASGALATAAEGDVIGVSLLAGASGDRIPCAQSGVLKMTAAGAIAQYDEVSCVASGKIATLDTDSTDRGVGIALWAALADGDVIPVQFYGPKHINEPTRFLDGSLNLDSSQAIGILIDGAFAWRDCIASAIYRDVGAGSPTRSAFQGNVNSLFYGANDNSDMHFHVPHDYAHGTDIFVHAHWGHNGTAISGSLIVNFETTVAKGHNQANFTSTVTTTMTVSTPDIATVPRYRHRIDEFQLSAASPGAGQIASSLLEPDTLVMINVKPTTIPTITGGSPDQPAIFEVDLHYQSTGIGTKQKAPDFYA